MTINIITVNVNAVLRDYDEGSGPVLSESNPAEESVWPHDEARRDMERGISLTETESHTLESDMVTKLDSTGSEKLGES